MPKIVDHDERRAQIVDALWRVVAKDGAAAVSVRSVAAEAGMSKTSIGHYFPSQGQLVGMAVEQTIETVTAKVLTLDLANCTVRTATDAIVAMIPDTAKRRRQADVWLMLLSAHNVDPGLAPVLRELNETVRDGIRVLLVALDEQGLLAPDRELDVEVASLHGLVDGLSLQTLTDPKLMSNRTVRKLITAYLEALAR